MTAPLIVPANCHMELNSYPWLREVLEADPDFGPDNPQLDEAANLHLLQFPFLPLLLSSMGVVMGEECGDAHLGVWRWW